MVNIVFKNIKGSGEYGEGARKMGRIRTGEAGAFHVLGASMLLLLYHRHIII